MTISSNSVWPPLDIFHLPLNHSPCLVIQYRLSIRGGKSCSCADSIALDSSIIIYSTVLAHQSSPLQHFRRQINSETINQIIISSMTGRDTTLAVFTLRRWLWLPWQTTIDLARWVVQPLKIRSERDHKTLNENAQPIAYSRFDEVEDLSLTISQFKVVLAAAPQHVQ